MAPSFVCVVHNLDPYVPETSMLKLLSVAALLVIASIAAIVEIAAVPA
jgi:hypothetical protein